MPSYNKITIMGHVGRDPESFKSEKTEVVKFSIATNERYGDNETTTWHNVVCFGKTAEIAAERVRKGALVLIEGRQENKTYTYTHKETGEERKGFDSSVIARLCFVLTGGKRREEKVADFMPTGDTKPDDFGPDDELNF